MFCCQVVVLSIFWFYLYSGYQSFIRYMICKYFLPLDVSYLLCWLFPLMHKSFSLMSIFALFVCAFCVIYKNSLPSLMSWIFPMFSFSFISLMFSSIIYFDSTFVYSVRKRSIFHFWMWISSLPNTICGRDCLFPIEWS